MIKNILAFVIALTLLIGTTTNRCDSSDTVTTETLETKEYHYKYDDSATKRTVNDWTTVTQTETITHYKGMVGSNNNKRIWIVKISGTFTYDSQYRIISANKPRVTIDVDDFNTSVSSAILSDVELDYDRLKNSVIFKVKYSLKREVGGIVIVDDIYDYGTHTDSFTAIPKIK
ncbi:hypothetical protein AN1V17_37930 [Vallitalea sediminicola]